MERETNVQTEEEVERETEQFLDARYSPSDQDYRPMHPKSRRVMYSGPAQEKAGVRSRRPVMKFVGRD